MVPVGSREEVVDGAAEARLHVLDRGREVGADLGRALHAERRDRVADEAAGLHEPGARALLHALLRPPSPPRSAGRCAARPGTNAAGTGRLAPRQHEHGQRLRVLGGEVEVRHHRVLDEGPRVLEVRHVPGERGLLAGEPAVLVLLGRLVADVGEVGADRAAAAVDHVAGAAALLLDQLLARG